MTATTATVTIAFGNSRSAKHFAQWLSGQGEQDYWVWMDARESEEAGDITATRFERWQVDPETGNVMIPTRMGRLSPGCPCDLECCMEDHRSECRCCSQSRGDDEADAD